MKSTILSCSTLLTALAILLAGCSAGEQANTFAETTTTPSPIATIETTVVTTDTSAATAVGPLSETCADQTTGASMDYDRALAIAQASPCATEGQLLETHVCNENSGTWWIDLAANKADCSPACVVSVNTGAAEINWRCTGALPPAGNDEAAGETPSAVGASAPAVFDYGGWGTYVNEAHGYQVKVPPGVVPLWDDESAAVTFEGPLEDDEHWPMFFIGHGATQFYRPDEDVPVRQWVESHTGEPEESFNEDTRIAGLEAYHVARARSPQSYAGDQYYFIKDGQMFSVDILHAGDRQDWLMYEQFLQSFTFPGTGEPAGDGTAVKAWTGVISANPPGSQSRYLFDRQDGQRWIIGTSEESLWPTIAEAAWTGAEVQLDGVEAPMPGLIDVSSITFLGEPAIEPRNLSYFAQPSASSALPSDRLGSYQAWSAVDGVSESPWCEGVDGPGTGQWLELLFESPLEVTMIRLANGYSYDGDIFTMNNRVKRATFIFSNGERLEWLFDDTVGWQEVPLARAPGPNMTISGVTILIDEVYPGSVYDDTCIGEVEIWGRAE